MQLNYRQIRKHNDQKGKSENGGGAIVSEKTPQKETNQEDDVAKTEPDELMDTFRDTSKMQNAKK